MKLQKLPLWTEYDIFHYIQTKLNLAQLDYVDVQINRYQIQEEDDRKYFELYTSQFTFDIEMTYNEFLENIIYTEKVEKEFKTVKGLLRNCIKAEESNFKNEYEFNFISEL